MITTITIIAAIGVFAFALFKFIKRKLTRSAKEFDDAPINDDCVFENPIYRVGITNYATEFGAKKRCEYLYRRYNINAEVTIIYPSEQVITKASTIWDLTR